MSPIYFSGGDAGQTIGTMNLIETEVGGTGGAVYPRLLIPARIQFHRLAGQKCDCVYRELNAQLLLPSLGKIADSLPARLERVQRNHWLNELDEHVILEFPLEARRIAKIEEIRNGGDLDLTLHIHLSADQYGVIEGDEKVKRPPLWGLLWPQKIVANGSLKIPRTIWIERVLPFVGHGTVQVIELPAVAIASCQTLEHSFKALKQAEEKHKLGFYDDAVGKCRIALDKFFDSEAVDPTHPASRKIPVLKKSWETKLGQATYDWLNKSLGAVKYASDRTHHSPNAHYDQFESQMIIAITTALVVYVARTTPSETEI